MSAAGDDDPRDLSLADEWAGFVAHTFPDLQQSNPTARALRLCFYAGAFSQLIRPDKQFVSPSERARVIEIEALIRPGRPSLLEQYEAEGVIFTPKGPVTGYTKKGN